VGTVYITQDDCFIGKTDERLNIRANKQKLLDVPLINIEGVVIMGRATVSPAVVTELLNRHIPLSFLTTTGRYLGRLEPELTKNIFVRKAQWQASGETEKSLHLVRGFIRGKLKNYRTALLRKQRERTDVNFQTATDRLKQILSSLTSTATIDSFRGLEGAGSAAYFQCFDALIRSEGFSFEARRRRPPTDPVNALLSLGYSLLSHDIQSAVNIVGFDPYLGYLHVERYGRPSLALDLMEEFRPIVVDAMVLNAINNRIITPAEFTTEPISNAVSLTPEALRTFLRLYEQKKQSDFTHPVMGKKCTYQESFEIQGRLMAKYLMEEIDQYPPLVLK
jgi:CRISPR-associated protein Cas1